jgi:hypothetical protein
MSYSSCLATSSISLACAASVGGIVKAYVVAGVISGETRNGDDEVLTLSGSGNVYTYEVQKQTSQMTETLNSSLENGTTFYQQDLVLSFHKIDSEKRNQLKLLAQNRGLRMFVEDNNGTIYYLGDDYGGGYTSAASTMTGTAFGDKNGYEITFSFFASEPAPILAGTLASTLSGLTINA